jgi:hypothetical protein
MKAKLPGRFTAQILSAVNENQKPFRLSSQPIKIQKSKPISGQSSDPEQADQAPSP